MSTETATTRTSAYGRFADDLTRDSVSGRSLDVRLGDETHRAQIKSDGYFAFSDLEPSATNYSFLVDAAGYQKRTLDVNVPTVSLVEVALPGEDEMFVLVSGIDAATKQVSFATPPFIPTIRADAEVVGEGGFSSILQEDVEGSALGFATLDDVAGLAEGDALRIVRSPRLILKPGPYYPFEPGTTLVAVKVVENTLGDPPIRDAVVTIDRVEGAALGTKNVGGVTLHMAAVPGPALELFGPDRAIAATSNKRGDTVFYHGFTPAISSIRVTVTKAGYVSANDMIMITAGNRVSRVVKLDRA